MNPHETGKYSRRGNVNRELRSTNREFDFTLFLGSYFSRIYSHRTYLILDIFMCKMFHIKLLTKNRDKVGNKLFVPPLLLYLTIHRGGFFYYFLTLFLLH